MFPLLCSTLAFCSLAVRLAISLFVAAISTVVGYCRYGLTSEHLAKVQQQMASIAEKLHLQLREPSEPTQSSGEQQQQQQPESEAAAEACGAAEAGGAAEASQPQPVAAEKEEPFVLDHSLLGEGTSAGFGAALPAMRGGEARVFGNWVHYAQCSAACRLK